MRRPIVILAAAGVLAALVASGAYAVMRDSGGGSESESVVVRESPQPSAAPTLTPAPAQGLPVAATPTSGPATPGQEGEPAQGAPDPEPQPGGDGPSASIGPPRDPDWTPGPLPENMERRGNCVVPKGAVEVSSEAAMAAGGLVFDYGYTRYYVLPDGRCISVSGAESPPDWVPPNLLTPEPGYEKRGNCVVPEDAVEIFPDAATAAGGRVFEYGFTKYYSLPSGRCITILGATHLLPDWVTPSIEQEYWPAPIPTKEGEVTQ